MLRLAMVISVIFLCSCASTTLIKSEPSGAKVFADGALIGKTPVTYSDTKIVGSTTSIRLQKDGCEQQSFNLSRSEKFEVGPCIGGVFAWVPFLWVMGYNPEHNYELECKGKGKDDTK
ncbi:MAG: PEGA domain-containing protein [Oligoflexales bacterium]|nr:PEGA domain-containing protein [Oligoflexales bacterium]